MSCWPLVFLHEKRRVRPRPIFRRVPLGYGPHLHGYDVVLPRLREHYVVSTQTIRTIYPLPTGMQLWMAVMAMLEGRGKLSLRKIA